MTFINVTLYPGCRSIFISSSFYIFMQLGPFFNTVLFSKLLHLASKFHCMECLSSGARLYIIHEGYILSTKATSHPPRLQYTSHPQSLNLIPLSYVSSIYSCTTSHLQSLNLIPLDYISSTKSTSHLSRLHFIRLGYTIHLI